MKKLLSLFAALAVVTSALALNVADITDVTPKVDEPPQPVKTPPPEYPDALKSAKVSGTVVVTVVIDENGDVLAAEVKKTTNEGFGAPAVEAVKHWKFNPAKVGGKAVKVKVAIPIRFTQE